MVERIQENGKPGSETDLNDDVSDFKVSGYGYRHQQCFIMFICLTTGYSIRACIGVALVGMMENHPLDINYAKLNISLNNRVDISNETGFTVNSSQLIDIVTLNVTELHESETSNGILSALLLVPPYPEFKWTKKIQDLVISSFFLGYMVMQIPAGQLVHKFGPRYLLIVAFFVNFLMSLCFPWAVYYIIDSSCLGSEYAGISLCKLLFKVGKMIEKIQENGKPSPETNLNDDISDFKVSGYGYRHQQCLIMFICLTTGYSMRACIGVALVGMIENHPVEHNYTNFNIHLNNTVDIFNDTGFTVNSSQLIDMVKLNETESHESETSNGILSALLLVPPYPKFKWSKKIQDVVISSFFWGYMVMQIPAGQLVHKFGPRYLLFGALLINFVVSLCFPWAAYYGGWIMGAACRVLQGLSQAFIIPGMYGFFGQWSPLEERSRLVGFAQGGQALGTVMGLPLTGFIAASPLGWPGIFRFYGILSGLVAALVYFMVSDTPSQHPKISLAEKRYIEEGLGLKEGEKKKKMPVPWGHILRCRALYGIALAHISQTYGQITLFAEIPAFMNKVMKVDIRSNGLLTALPFLVMWFTSFFFNWFTDWIIVNKYLSVTNARKMANSIGCIPAAFGLVVLAYVPKSIATVESILVFICAFKISAHVGSMVTHVDIAPNFAGTMMSISNFCSNLFGSQAPLIASFLVADVTSAVEWRKVFFVAAGLYFFTNIAYCILGTAEKAPWNDPEDDDEDPEDVPEMQPMIPDDHKKEVN